MVLASARRRTRSPFGARILGPRHQEPRQLRIRVQVLLTALLLITNMLGAGVVFVVNTWAIPSPDPNGPMLLALVIAVPTYVVVGAIIGMLLGTAASLHALRWATVPDSVPTAAERVRALRVPMWLTLLQFGIWAVGILLFTLLAVILQPERIVGTALTVGIGAVVVAGLAYLLTEFAMRPIAARALDDQAVTSRMRGAGVGARLVLFWTIGTAAPVIGLLTTAILALTAQEATRRQLAVVTITVCAVVLGIGGLLIVLFARAIVGPVVAVRDAMREVAEGNLDVDVVVYDGTELGQLQSGFNAMVHGLQEREKIRDLFGRHVGQEVAEAATEAATGEIALGGRTLVASVLFVDLVGSTTYATQHGPVEVVAMLNRFFAVVVDEVTEHGGLVNKFLGDAVLAIFGAPVELPDHATRALEAGRAMATRLASEVPEVGAGVGIATGTVVVGNVGHESRFEYTAIGDAVNSAARLTDLAKDVPGGVLATAESVNAADAGEAGHWASYGEALLRGRAEPTRLAVPAAHAEEESADNR